MSSPIALAIALALVPPARAAEGPTRALRIGPSAQMLLDTPEGLGTFGTGVWTSYDFILKPSFNLGINLAWRFHPGETSLNQVGYGLLMKHYVANADEPAARFAPFFEYGLLLQISMEGGREGSATSHDTRLGGGTDLRLGGQTFYGEASWHYSRARFFEIPEIPLDDVELVMGWRHTW